VVKDKYGKVFDGDGICLLNTDPYHLRGCSAQSKGSCTLDIDTFWHGGDGSSKQYRMIDLKGVVENHISRLPDLEIDK